MIELIEEARRRHRKTARLPGWALQAPIATRSHLQHRNLWAKVRPRAAKDISRFAVYTPSTAEEERIKFRRPRSHHQQLIKRRKDKWRITEGTQHPSRILACSKVISKHSHARLDQLASQQNAFVSPINRARVSKGQRVRFSLIPLGTTPHPPGGLATRRGYSIGGEIDAAMIFSDSHAEASAQIAK